MVMGVTVVVVTEGEWRYASSSWSRSRPYGLWELWRVESWSWNWRVVPLDTLGVGRDPTDPTSLPVWSVSMGTPEASLFRLPRRCFLYSHCKLLSMQRLQTVKASGVRHFRWTTSAWSAGPRRTEVTSETHLCGSASKARDLTGTASVEWLDCGQPLGRGRPTVVILTREVLECRQSHRSLRASAITAVIREC